jgi:hypothetical protein
VGRFSATFDQRQALRREGKIAWWRRPLRVATGVLLILMGIAIGWLPGPGFVPLAVGGAYLLSGEIRWVGTAMDRLEIRVGSWLDRRSERRRRRRTGTKDEETPK